MAKQRPSSLPRRRKSVGAYYNTHTKNIIKQRPISTSNFEGGLIVKMDYFGKTTGRYNTAFYLIINPSYKNYVHVFDIDFVPASALRFIIELTKNKKLEDFLFSQTTFSYYNFPSYGKSLYTKLLPIMNDSYRKLIRNPKYIRRTYVVDYDFGKIRNAIKPKFVYPNIEDEMLELESTAREYDLDRETLISSAKKGRLTTLNPTIWSKLKNTDSWTIGMTQEDVRKNALARGKSIETTNRIIAGMKSSQTFYAPIILKYKDEFDCVAGNTRLMTAMSLKVIPKVYIFSYIEE
jgi:hypothetical protein